MRCHWLVGCLLLSISCQEDVAPSVAQHDPIPDCIFVSEPSPEFPGGQQALYMFIQNNLVAPKSNAEGCVFVSFVVGKDGFVSDVEVIRGLNQECDEHAIGLVKKMPRWNPGEDLNGNLVRTRMVIPIKFSY